ncbi:ATP-dependent zinc protease family protein [Marilutibacter chinensis]|uniref:RimK/LysX family protein n=1 Tax=Marilutibacter chinensis TaxID=2912247 RepID=A0ABS9HZ27_9GAMM|nr:RimK/LysX family protein [Lysobacter chinensis]MCF7223399.1 RimK/LysX family protein [Lysobacter chinensis]
MSNPTPTPAAASIVLGWREWVALPALGLDAVRAKVDSGARSSALHVDRQWRFVEGGAPWVGFALTPGAGPDTDGEAGIRAVEAVAPVFDEREVTDSGGHTTRRVFLCTTMRLAGIEREIEINLSDRRGMLFPMLLGRTAIAPTFTIDPARSFLHGRPPADGATVHRRPHVPR